ncbi:cytochrome P450 [Mycena epipterygia]|nr:cytochrome P450 [Mycena epipterygia]
MSGASVFHFYPRPLLRSPYLFSLSSSFLCRRQVKPILSSSLAIFLSLSRFPSSVRHPMACILCYRSSIPLSDKRVSRFRTMSIHCTGQVFTSWAGSLSGYYLSSEPDFPDKNIGGGDWVNLISGNYDFGQPRTSRGRFKIFRRDPLIFSVHRDPPIIFLSIWKEQREWFIFRIAGTLASYIVFQIAKIFYEEFTSSLRDLPGPTGGNLVLGHFRAMEMVRRVWCELPVQGLFNVVDNKSSIPDSTVKESVETRSVYGRHQGLLAVEMDEHKRQATNTFSRPHISTGGYRGKYWWLRDIWMQDLADDVGSSRIDLLIGLRKMTLDVIGEAANAWAQTNQASAKNMVRIAKQPLADSKAAIQASGEKSATGRDLLSIMVKANMSDGDQKLSDADVIEQMILEIPTFFVAGNETTRLMKLREELLSMPTDNPTMDELNSLPYLDWVVRESLRLYSPVAFTLRVVMSCPSASRYAKERPYAFQSPPSIVTRKFGGMMWLSSEPDNPDKTTKPDQWENIPEETSTIPSIWRNLLTFLTGPHNCIGFRFSIVE